MFEPLKKNPSFGPVKNQRFDGKLDGLLKSMRIPVGVYEVQGLLWEKTATWDFLFCEAIDLAKVAVC